jgi:hypothetical protein
MAEWRGRGTGLSQAFASAASGGVDFLLRMTDPDDGSLFPALFDPAKEDSALDHGGPSLQPSFAH